MTGAPTITCRTCLGKRRVISGHPQTLAQPARDARRSKWRGLFPEGLEVHPCDLAPPGFVYELPCPECGDMDTEPQNTS